MTTITEPTTVRHNVGTCPACHAHLWAEVDIAVKVSPPTLDRMGKAHAFASPLFLGMRVEHQCSRDETNGDWEGIADSRPKTAPRTDAEASEVPEGPRDAESGVCAAGVGGGEVCMRPAGHDGDHDPDSTEVAE